ncbi:MAG: hypothetical protein NT038_05515, partial [Euryarchaeota archaeon]|nr:hypothetical protein [Euryarchaeota archaeon]
MSTEGNQPSFNKSASSSLPTNKKFLKIEDIVDKLLEENKDKITNMEITKDVEPSVFTDKRIYVNPVKVEDFSPRKRRPHSIYFVRKQPSKKDIAKNKEQEKKTSNNKPVKVKKRIRFGKPTTQTMSKDKSSEKPLRKTRDIPFKQKESIPIQKIEKSSPRTKKPSMWAKKKSLVSQKDVDQQEKQKSPSEKKLDDVDHANEDEARWIDSQIGKASELKTKNEAGSEGKIEEIAITKKRSISEIIEKKNKQRLDEGSAFLVEDSKGKGTLNDTDLKPFGTEVETEAVLQQFQTTSASKQISPESSPANLIIKGKTKGVISPEALFLKNSTLKELGLSEKQWDELDFYPLHEPFAYVEIVRDTESLDKRYVLVEVGLTEEEANALKFMQQTLKILPMNTVEMDEKGIDVYLREKIEQVFEEYKLDMDQSSKEKIIYYLEKNYLGLGRINAVMQDPHIEDISCDGSNVPIFLYHREYGSLKSNIVFPEEEELSGFVVRLAQ